MPIYEYQCKKCNEVFDYILLKNEPSAIPQCRKCGSKNVKKLVSRVRYLGGPKEDVLASNAEQKLLRSFGGRLSEKTEKQIRQMAKKAASRGKRRFEKMMDTGSGESEE